MTKAKSLVLSLLLCLLCNSAYSEVIISGGVSNFPDEIFREYVNENFDTDGDGVLSDSELEAVQENYVGYYANLPGKISSLKGIEHFTSLTALYCSDNED